MKIPRPISKGDVIGVTAPSYGVTEQLDRIRFDNAVANLESRGYSVRMTPDVYAENPDNPVAPAEQRVKELMSLIDSDDVGCIISAKGGDNQIQMLPLMDFDETVKNPKWIQGFSDNTVLLFKLTAEYDMATIYCNNFGDMGMDPWHGSVSDNLSFLEGAKNIFGSYEYHEIGFHDRITGLETVSDDEATVWTSDDVSFGGRLIGGCMDVLEWFHRKNTADISGFTERYSGEGIVWYMETFDMNENRIREMFRGMKKDGWFEGCEGFVFGRPLFYEGADYRKTVSEELSDLNVPVVFDADVGHKAPRMTFVNGLYSKFTISDGKCILTYDR
jgi:muramoyltetrapeptide carboxypeptidase